jgi:hypothetical protein
MIAVTARVDLMARIYSSYPDSTMKLPAVRMFFRWGGKVLWINPEWWADEEFLGPAPDYPYISTASGGTFDGTPFPTVRLLVDGPSASAGHRKF